LIIIRPLMSCYNKRPHRKSEPNNEHPDQKNYVFGKAAGNCKYFYIFEKNAVLKKNQEWNTQ